MKWIAFLLLGANLAFVGFQILNTSPGEDAHTGTTVSEWHGPARLSRISEMTSEAQPPPREAIDRAVLPQGMETETDTGTSVVESVSTSSRLIDCYSAGFPDEQSAVTMRAVLETAGITAGVPRIEHTERIRYWVLLPPYRSDQQARTAVERLKKAGLKDYYLIPNGENKNALSLGVFSSREAARQRISDVAHLNLKIRVEEVKFPSQRYVLDLRSTSGQFPPEWQRLLPAGTELTAETCD